MTWVWIFTSACWLALCVWLMRKRLSQRLTRILFVAGGLLHLAAFASPPYFSDDIARYQWDGIVATHGISPYRFAPNDSTLSWLHTQDLPERVTYPHIHTIYPPVAEWWFAASTWMFGETLWWKLPTFLAEMGALVLLMLLLRQRGLRPELVLIAALSPCMIFQFSMDAHVDVVMMFFVLASLYVVKDRPVLGGVLLAMGIGVKFLPVLFLPWLLYTMPRRKAAVYAISTLAASIVIVGVSYDPWMFVTLKTYASVWSANSAWHWMLHRVIDAPNTVRYVSAASAGIVIIVAWIRYRERPIIGMQLAMMAVLAFSPVTHPWYAVPVIAFAVLRPMRSSIVLAATMSFYGLFVMTQKESGVWLEHPAWLLLEYVPVYVALALDMRQPPLLLDERKSDYLGTT